MFLEKYHGYQQKGEEYQLIELRNNFRSRSEVLTFVNDVFYQIMHELAAQGVAVIMNSSDMMEVIGMSSRVIVMYEGRISGTLQKEELSEELIMQFGMGMKKERTKEETEG